MSYDICFFFKCFMKNLVRGLRLYSTTTWSYNIMLILYNVRRRLIPEIPPRGSMMLYMHLHRVRDTPVVAASRPQRRGSSVTGRTWFFSGSPPSDPIPRTLQIIVCKNSVFIIYGIWRNQRNKMEIPSV